MHTLQRSVACRKTAGLPGVVVLWWQQKKVHRAPNQEPRGALCAPPNAACRSLPRLRRCTHPAQLPLAPPAQLPPVPLAACPKTQPPSAPAALPSHLLAGLPAHCPHAAAL